MTGSGPRKRQDYNFLGGAYLLSTCLHETYRDLIIKSARAAVSAREHDILSWGAEGKTDEDIGTILGISTSTVRFHWEQYIQNTGGEWPYLCDYESAAPAHYHPGIHTLPLSESIVYGARRIRVYSCMIDCVNIATAHCFAGNLIAAQHRLRYQEVIAKEDWSNIYVAAEMEFDRYDNVATEYFVARDAEGKVRGVCRSYPTTIPYMLSDVFSFLCSQELPCSHKVHEASRLVLDRSLLTKEARRPIVDELIVAYMERGMHRNIDAYVGFMLPRIWNSTFLRAGGDIEWLGPEIALPGTADIVRAGLMPVSERMNDTIRDATGIRTPILNYGSERRVSYTHAGFVFPPASGRQPCRLII